MVRTAFLLLVLLVIGCQTDNSKRMEATQKGIIEDYINAYNSFDTKGMIKDFHPDIVFENISGEEVDLTTNGIEEFSNQAEQATAYFSKRKQSIDSWDFDGNTVTVSIDYNAILAIDLPNGMKVGDTLQLKGQSVFEFRDDKIIKIQDKS